MEDLKKRTRSFALRIVRLYISLPEKGATGVLRKQLLRSGTSVGAHCAEASRAKSRADFVNKINGALQELEETLYWIELLVESESVKASRMPALKKECNELAAIFTTLIKKTKAGGLK